MIAAILFVSVLLLVGLALRLRLRVFQRLYIPASVIAGGVGLLVVQATAGSAAVLTESWSQTLRGWPGWLIAVVFAGMLLERKPASFAESLSRVGRQGLMVWVIVLGQTAVGLWVTWLLIEPFYDVPHSFGMLIETGMAGGHGTAAAMGQVYAHPTINLTGGLDLGVLMATCGLVYGVVSGILWVNIGVRAGWAGSSVSLDEQPTGTGADNDRGSPIGYAKIGGDALDPLLLQVIWLTLAFGIGMGLQFAVAQCAGYLELWIGQGPVPGEAEQQLSGRLSLRSIVGSFPLFIYTLFGGLIVRRALRAVGFEQAIDRETINRLTAMAMDILVVAAIATLNVAAVATLILPFLTLFLFGAIWSGVCLLVLSRWLLPRQHWFQLGLINYGMSTGTTATGFVLLRLVDPELESGAAEDYALAAPLSSPFIGGGMITIGLPLLILERFPIAVPTLILTAMVIALIVIGHRWNTNRSH